MKPGFVAFLVLPLAACTSAPQFIQSTNTGSAATLEKFGSALSLCGLTGQGVCQARVHAIDLKWVAQTESVLKLDPGRHSLLVGCHFANQGSPNGIKVTFQTYDMEFSERTLYKIEAEQASGQCRTSVVDTSSGGKIEGKNVP